MNGARHPAWVSDEPGEYSYSLVDQADRAIALWRDRRVTEADVVAHDYGPIACQALSPK